MPTSLSVPSLIETCRFLSDPALDGRYPGSEGHETAKQYLQALLERLGFEPLFGGSWLQPVMSGRDKVGDNVGGILRGRSDRSIVLAAHYDHFKGCPGADDNAAALSILLETSRMLGPWGGEHNVVVCFFDLEEPPYFHSPTMGSVYFTKHCPVDLDRLTCAVVLDLCGHDVPIPGQEDAYFILGAESSAELVRVVRSVEGASVPTYMFANARIGDMSDHHALRVCEKPYLFFSCGWWEHYHSPTDTFERLNPGKMQRFTRYLVELVRALDWTAVQVNPVPEFWMVEAESLQRLVGIAAPASEEAVTQLIQTLLGRLAQRGF